MQSRCHDIKLSQVRVDNPTDPDVHLTGIFWQNWFVCLEFLAYEVHKLAAGAVHANLLWVEGATLSHFIPRSDVLLLLDLVLTVGKSASVSEATTIIEPIFANFSFLFYFVCRLSCTYTVFALTRKLKLKLLICRGSSRVSKSWVVAAGRCSQFRSGDEWKNIGG
jgi:hypothetical protein